MEQSTHRSNVLLEPVGRIDFKAHVHAVVLQALSDRFQQSCRVYGVADHNGSSGYPAWLVGAKMVL